MGARYEVLCRESVSPPVAVDVLCVTDQVRTNDLTFSFCCALSDSEEETVWGTGACLANVQLNVHEKIMFAPPRYASVYFLRLFRQQADGIQGLAAGLFQGLAGVATKPMVGCLDAVTHTGEAVREMAGGLATGDGALASRRSRLPQPFGPDGRMMPRTVETAYGAMILAQFPLWKVRGYCTTKAP